MKLNDIHKDNIFNVPDDYFENFPDRLHKRINQGKTGKDIRIMPVAYPLRIAIAASVTILLAAVLSLFIINKNTPGDLLADVPTNALISYLEESEMSTDEMLDNLDLSLLSDEDYMDEFYLFPEEEDLDNETIDQMLEEYELELDLL